ncbi:motility protein A [Niveispirillum irakense]|uniref:motility protein A n=1 Tax=Niveispirillum irakense TaxID=34011 RepID=UPI0004088AFE|nr:MotA/TolQ/ExbB proton channel family protein [Niveispirillum irakense]
MPAPRRSGLVITSLLGVVTTILLLVFVAHAGGDARFFYNQEGLIIVVGGVICVALLAFSWAEITAALSAVASIFRHNNGVEADVAHLVEVSKLLYARQVQAADEKARKVSSPFLRLGLQMVVDGATLDDLMNVMNWRIQKLVELEQGQSRFFRVLASFAPAFGLLGTLAGMVGMLKQLGAGDIGLIGSSMAVAMLATLYGLILANLMFKPLAIKLEQRTTERVANLNLLLEGIVLAHLGRSPSVIQDTLQSYLLDARDEVSGER